MNEFDQKAATWDDDPKRVERARVIAGYLQRQVNTGQFGNILEYGSGTGLLSLALYELGAFTPQQPVTLMDDSAAMTAIARRKLTASGLNNWQAIQYDLLAAPLPDGRYDFIFTLLTLHHIADTRGILQRFRQLSAPGGVLGIIDLEKEDGSFHEGEFHGHKGFDRYNLEADLQATGWQPEHYSVCYRIEKEDKGTIKTYPLFMLLARRAS